MESQFLKKIIVASTIILVVVFSAGYFVYNKIVSPTIITPAKFFDNGIDLSQAPVSLSYKPAPTQPFEFKGTLYFSLAKIGGTQALGIHSFKIDGVVGERWKRILAGTISSDKNYYIYISPSISDDGKKMVFARKKITASALQIFTSDVSGKNMRQITNTPDKYKREPVFSPGGELIAYISHNTKSSANDPDPEIPENWSTYLTDINGNAVRVAAGINPIFSPDGEKLLVLQNDGLHIFDISIWNKPKALGLVVKTVGGRASQTMKIGVSADGTMIAWPSISKENVVVSRINSWDNFSITPFLTIKTKAYWTVFSPDKKYLAVVEWRKDSTNKEYPEVMGYDLSNGKSEVITTLTSDDKSFLWLGSWK